MTALTPMHVSPSAHPSDLLFATSATRGTAATAVDTPSALLSALCGAVVAELEMLVRARRQVSWGGLAV